MVAPTVHRPFDFVRDTFAFRNELLWTYHPQSGAGRMVTRRTSPPPAYVHRCFVLVRAARQFWQDAVFDPTRPPPDALRCEALAREVVRRNPRRGCGAPVPVCIPGFQDLRDFSARAEAAVKRACGGAWRSYCVRGHWRMVFPFPRRHQDRTAAALMAGLAGGRLPIVHLVRFPQLTINHALLLFATETDPNEVRFTAYDPNTPEAAVTLQFDRGDRSFRLPANAYWAGGRVDVYETYCGWFY